MLYYFVNLETLLIFIQLVCAQYEMSWFWFQGSGSWMRTADEFHSGTKRPSGVFRFSLVVQLRPVRDSKSVEI